MDMCNSNCLYHVHGRHGRITRMHTAHVCHTRACGRLVLNARNIQ